MNRHLMCCGDATDLDTFSNTPYFLLQAGIPTGLLQAGVALHPEKLVARARLWNLVQLARSGKAGGFQYSLPFNTAVMKQAPLDDRPTAILSLFPFLPPTPWPRRWSVDFYIDATTKQIYEDYKAGERIGEHVKRAALGREREAYRQAGVVICMCEWAADSVIRDYGIDPAKVHVVVGGANFDEGSLKTLAATPPPAPPTEGQPLRLGLLGKYWERKGGPFLLELVDALAERGVPAVVRAIGIDPAALPAHPRLQALGFISKKTALPDLVRELQSWHFGTLFSEAEASPRSNLECLRLGVPVITHAVGGIASTLPDEGCGKLFAAHPDPADVAAWVAARLDPYDAYLGWRTALGRRAHEFTWAAAVQQMAPLLNRA